MAQKTALIILDGWGIAKNKEVSAVDKANTPFFDKILSKYPNSTLQASGLEVGLPEGQMGNSEVGHLNLGAGRVVYQNLTKINLAIKNNELSSNSVLKEAFEKAKSQNGKLHFMGLLSNGGVHSDINHLKALIQAAHENGVAESFIHAFTDGRDVDPKSGKGFVEDLQSFGEKYNSKIATITGRYYAMDRDNRWERIKLTYDALTQSKGQATENIVEAIQNNYDNDITDEFIKPIIHTKNNNPIAPLEENDVLICFNFRTDRGREISQVLTQKSFPEYNMTPLKLNYYTMTNYDNSFKDVSVIFNNEDITETMGEVLENNNKTQIRIAETEKYPHVTFFFSGGREKEFEGEKRILCPSPKVATYDLQPEMSAYDITDAILPELENKTADFICLNFANPDMVGHTGDMDAAIKACEVVDSCLEKIVTTGIQNDYAFVVIADHGNADCMSNEDGSPNTAHTTQPVPCILVNSSYNSIKNGKLGDISPTILKILEVEIPEKMTGNCLV